MTNQYEAGVKDYRLTYWEPEYQPKDTDLLAVFKAVPQPGVPREEVAAAVAAESSTGTWTTVWTDLLTDLDHYRGRAYRIEDVPGDPEAFYAYVAYPLDLFEEGSVVNVLTSLVGNVFGFKALRSLRLEDIRFPLRNRIIAMLCRAVIVVEAAVTGGALITATKAMEYGINVFAVPGDVDRESSVGCNLLIRDGAHPVLGSDDLVEELSLILGPPAVISAKNE